MGRSNFQLQFMLDTSLSDAEKFPLKFQDSDRYPSGDGMRRALCLVC